MSSGAALDRTVRLLGGDLLVDLSPQEIVTSLTTTRVLLGADRRNLEASAAQSALVATFCCLAELGFEVVLDIPDVPVAGSQPPLRGERLRPALLDLGKDLITPPGSVTGTAPIAQVLMGDTSSALDGGPPILRVGGDAFSARIEFGSVNPPRLRGEVPFGAILAGAAAAAEVLRMRCADLAAAGTRMSPEFDLGRPRSVAIELPPVPLCERAFLGDFDVVSAGAITNAFFFALMRIAHVGGAARVFDHDRAEESNLNRYPLLRRFLLGQQKVDILADLATGNLRIVPVARMLDEEAIAEFCLAERVIIGADHIPSRWVVQRHCRGWMCVGATTHFTAMVSEHNPQGPCAGCLHPRDDSEGPALLPTISFVSMLAGTLQAYRAYAHAVGVEPQLPTLAAGFNLAAPTAVSAIGLAPAPRCPVGCQASRQLEAV